MLRDLAEEHEVVRRTIEEANDVLRERLGATYQHLMFTATRSSDERAALERSLATRSDIVQPVLVTANVALHRLVASHGVQPGVFAGHSLGEYAALVAAGVLEFGQAVRAAHARGEAFRELAARSGDAGLMATVASGAEVVEPVLEGIQGYVAIANRNCPGQTVISGEDAAVRAAVGRLEAQAIECRVLPIAGAFHSRIAAAVRGRMADAVAALEVRPAALRVLSSVDLAYYEPSTDCSARVRTNLVEQLVTPVDFIGVVERLYADGHRVFVEMGPKNALSGFVDDILGEARPHRALFANHPKVGEIPQFDRFVAQHAIVAAPGTRLWVHSAPGDVRLKADATTNTPADATTNTPADATSVERAASAVQHARPPETVMTTSKGRSTSARPAGRGSAPHERAIGERIWITGVSVGLPGRHSRVFSEDAFERLLGGACLIEPVPESLQDRLVAKRITRLVKTENGEPYLDEVRSRDDGVKLAGQRGAFSLREDFGLEDEWLVNADITYQLAIAAGLEALRDARLPLQRAYRRTSGGRSLPAGWMLPASLQDDTAVVFASAYPGLATVCTELERYYASTYGAMTASALREQYLKRLQSASTEQERLEADQWFVEQRRALHLDASAGAYTFNRNFISDYVCMGNTRFAQLVHARGPNLAVNAACCSTSAALGMAEDIIRSGRARRVVVLGADDVSSETQFEWIASGFLAAGAAATDGDPAGAAIPFDRRRHGMIVGMGAVGFVIEAESAARERGLEPAAELLGVRLSNSATHMTRPDTEHVTGEMAAFMEDMRNRHGIAPDQIAGNLVYGSHETFTLPSGGIGAVEGRMLKQVFGERWRDVLVVNTKCATGHPQGAGLEDAILAKALRTGRVPPVLHSRDVDDELAGINLSRGGTTDCEYVLRFSAGFGSQLAMSLMRVVQGPVERVTSDAVYQAWLEAATGVPGASLTVVNRILQVREADEAPGDAPRVASRPAAMPVPGAAPRPSPAPVLPAPGPASAVAPGPAFVAAPPPAPAPAAVAVMAAASVPPAVAAPAADDIAEKVMSIIEEKTGYERRYLEADLDLEADLGIDTIKQAQVMARIRDTFELPKDKNIRVKDFPTIRHVVQYVQSRLGGDVAEAVTASPEAVTPVRAAAEGTAVTAAATPASASSGPSAVATEPAPAPPVVAAPAMPAPMPAASTPAVGQPPVHADSDDRVLDTVLRIIEKQTGYEREALGEDLDLEADLGIDTIKQAQVMARIRDEFQLPREQGIRVKDFPTIRHVVAFINSRLGASAPAAAFAPAVTATSPGSVAGALPEAPQVAAPAAAESQVVPPPGICRMAVRWVPQPIAQEPSGTPVGAGWTVLVTDDGLGVAEAVSRTLAGAGARVEVLQPDADLAAARAQLEHVRALILLHPLAMDPAVAALDVQSWREVLDRKVTATFRAVKALRGELELVVAVTAMSGPYGWRGQLVDPAGAGVAGVLKSFRHEAETAVVKVVDVERPAARAEAEHVAVTLLDEIARGGTRIEVAYRDGVRLAPRVVREPLDLSAPPVRAMTPDAVVVAIGGSRGVTAAVVKELARRYRPRLVLVATRPLPPDVAELAALDADGLKQLKEKMARGWKARVTGARPIEIERRFAATLQAIDAYRTMQACEAAGSPVTYEVCDVRDGDRVRDLVKNVQRQHGRIDGVIFGAGLIEDKLIEDKTPESFDRVFGVKAEGIFNVYKALDGVPLSFLATFSSVAGRFGNIGQADYSAGNEVLARFTMLIQAARPDARCVTLDWTGWDEVGLAARSGVIDLLKERGLDTLSPSQGARFFHEELIFGRGPEEVVIVGGEVPLDLDGQIEKPARQAAVAGAPSPQGLFLRSVRGYEKGAWLSATTTIEPGTDAWLGDHVIGGAPLVPAVFGIEMMAEAACLLFPGFHLWGIRNIAFLLAIKVLKQRPMTVKLTAVGQSGTTDEERIVRVRVASDFVGPDGRVLVADRTHYTGEVLVRSTPPIATQGDPGRLSGVANHTPIPPLYGEGGTLPHGPSFRVIERVDGLDAGGVVAAVAALDECRVLPALNGHRLLTLPFAREAAFQAAGLWGILRHNQFGLPHGCRALHSFGPPPPGTALRVRVLPRAVGAARIEYDIDLVGADGRLYDRMEGFYTVNPLAATDSSAQPVGSETGA